MSGQWCRQAPDSEARGYVGYNQIPPGTCRLGGSKPHALALGPIPDVTGPTRKVPYTLGVYVAMPVTGSEGMMDAAAPLAAAKPDDKQAIRARHAALWRAGSCRVGGSSVMRTRRTALCPSSQGLTSLKFFPFPRVYRDSGAPLSPSSPPWGPQSFLVPAPCPS